MHSVSEVYNILQNHALPLKQVSMPISNCLNYVAAADLYAPIPVPVFDNSAMDGYGILFEDVENNIPIKVIETIAAGEGKNTIVKSGEAVRIFTGAAIPEGVDTVVQQEICLVTEGILSFTETIKKGSHIRQQGTQTHLGDLILKKGTVLTAEYIGYLATFGIAAIPVFQKPKVGIINTGKELVSAGQPLQAGQIYESNGVSLKAVLQKIDIQPEFVILVDDDFNVLQSEVKNHIDKVDVLIFTGGISVGDYDFVKPVLESLGVQQHIYKVKQKPGKPLFFGTLNDKAIFALPGNPASVLTCYHVYVKRYLQLLMDHLPWAKTHSGQLTNSFTKSAKLTQFVKASVVQNEVEILSGQLSYQMDAYQKANAYAVLQEGKETFSEGETIEIIYF